MTLVEMVVSLAIVSMLLVASGSMMVVLAKTAPGSHTSSSRVDEGARVLEQLVAELEESTAIVIMTPDTIEFEVSDRDGDAAPERIRYRWTGSAGTPGPLMRQYNSGRNQVLIAAAHEFALEYFVESLNSVMTGPESIVSAYTANSLVTTQSLTKSVWPGQYFTPVLPGDAVSWEVTRVRFKAMPAGPASGDFFVQLRAVDGASLPTTAVLHQMTVLESELPGSLGWHEVLFTGAEGLAPAVGYALVLEYNSGSNAMTFEFEDAGAGLVDAGMVEYDKGSWTLDQDESLTYEVHGIATVPDPGGVAEDRLRGAAIVLNVAEGTTLRLRMQARTLNSPTVPGS